MVSETAPEQVPDHVACVHCAAQIPTLAPYCPQCRIFNPIRNTWISPRSITITALLCLFLGGTGAHRFYTGNTGAGFVTTGLLFLCVALSFLLGALEFDERGPFLYIALFLFINLWSLVDFVSIIFHRYRDGQGRPILN